MADGEVYGLDDLARLSGRPASQLLAELGELEVAGRVKRLTGGNFAKA
jgi:predicted Rossmann fold nucleotide-binding protein DprA/Smf involved in DNA uptake